MTGSGTDRLWRRVREYIAAGQAAPACAVLESILARDPSDTRARLTLGGVYASHDRQRAATNQVQAAAAHPSPQPEILLDLVTAAIRVGEFVIARKLLSVPVIQTSMSIPVLMSAAERWQLMGVHTKALAAIEQARAAGAQGSEFHFRRAVQLGFNGDLAAAEIEGERCIGFATAPGRAFVHVARNRKQTPESNHIAAIRAAQSRATPGGEEAGALDFALYKELEDLGRYEEAWQALQRGNANLHARLPYDAAHESAAFDQLFAACDSGFLSMRAAYESIGPQPIFVIGMPRSGTTVLERILGNHSKVESAGELGAFTQALSWATDHMVPIGLPDIVTLQRLREVDWAEVGQHYLAQTQWRANAKSFFVDKLPNNWMVAGLIHKALPHAHILNLLRDPMDVCFSNWRAYFGDGAEYGYSYEIDALVHRYGQYRRAMSHWHRSIPGVIMDVDFARLVREPEVVSSEVQAWCGLDFEPGCSELTRNATPSATLSMAQVRQPIHDGVVSAWRAYSRQLEPLRAGLRALPGLESLPD